MSCFWDNILDHPHHSSGLPEDNKPSWEEQCKQWHHMASVPSQGYNPSELNKALLESTKDCLLWQCHHKDDKIYKAFVSTIPPSKTINLMMSFPKICTIQLIISPLPHTCTTTHTPHPCTTPTTYLIHAPYHCLPHACTRHQLGLQAIDINPTNLVHTTQARPDTNHPPPEPHQNDRDLLPQVNHSKDVATLGPPTTQVTSATTKSQRI